MIAASPPSSLSLQANLSSQSLPLASPPALSLSHLSQGHARSPSPDPTGSHPTGVFNFAPASARSGPTSIHSVSATPRFVGLAPAATAEEPKATPVTTELNVEKLNAVQEEAMDSMDVGKLVEYLESLEEQEQKIVEIVYIVNNWKFGGILPMQHHGFIFKVTEDEFFTVDFGQKGICWMRSSVSPEYPDGTVWVKGYDVSVEPDVIRAYIQDSGSFMWGINDCKVWSVGLMREMEVDIDSGKDLPFEEDLPRAKPQKNICMACGKA